MGKKNKKKKRNRYVGKLPVNSRITIDYSKKKPTVKFEYPKKNTVSQVLSTAATLFPVLIIIVFTMLFVELYTPDFTTGDFPEMDDCDTYTNHYPNQTSLRGVTLKCNSGEGEYEIRIQYNLGKKFLFFKHPPELKPYYDSDDVELALGILKIFLILLIVPVSIFLLYQFYTKTKFGQRIFPELNKVMGDSHYYVKFDKVPASKEIEIPLFKNIYLDYKATKGFSKYLDRMEIREHPFNMITRKRKKRKMKINKTDKQIYLWKATFYFKDIPKDGKLEVWWT